MMAMIHQTMNRRAFAIAGLGAVVSVKATLAQPSPIASPTPAEPALYRVDLPTESLPTAPCVFGAVSVILAPGTTVEYPEGAAQRSVAIDHVLAGSYEIETDSELIHIDAAGKLTEIAAAELTTVATGETIVLLQNEAAQQITVGDEETYTLTTGFFSLQQGSHESTVEGSVEAVSLGGTILQAVPEPGVTVAVVSTDFASNLANALVQIPVMLQTNEAWTIVVLPQTVEATPVT